VSERETNVTTATEAPERDGAQPLLPNDDVGRFQHRWEEIQTRFVDEPRESVQKADGLVTELMERLSQTFVDERTKLEEQWDRGDEVSTEDLRVSLQRYRSFFNRLLAA
jgi:hypothetical protein